MSMEQKTSLPYPAADLVPHEKPMLLVDMVLQIADDDDPQSCSIVEASAPEGGVFVADGQVLHEYLIELMAQSIAAVDGFKSKPDNKQPAKPAKGFLAGIDAFTCTNTPTPGSKLQVRLKKTFAFGSVFIFEGSVHEENEILATGQLKIWKEDK